MRESVDVMATSGRFRLLAAIEALRYVEGEKHVVFLGSSITPARGRELVIARANDARVTIDFVSTSGMYVSPGGRFAFSGCQPCRDVVEATGGLYTSVDYMDQALAKVDQRSRTSYLLGYTPANTDDGRYLPADSCRSESSEVNGLLPQRVLRVRTTGRARRCMTSSRPHGRTPPPGTTLTPPRFRSP